MSFRVYFEFSVGLNKPLRVPKGTKDRVMAHVASVERALGIQREQRKDEPPRWKMTDFAGVPDELLCETAEKHNAWVRHFYEEVGAWSSEPVKGGERLTPADAREFWCGLHLIDVPPERWTADYYRARMEAAYEVMRGCESEGVTFDAEPLSPKQAATVIWLFDRWLDRHDIRLEVPNGKDELYDSDEYDWCEKCGAVADDEWQACRKRPCPLRKYMAEAMKD